jgi:S1-C subfamily serine protease
MRGAAIASAGSTGDDAARSAGAAATVDAVPPVAEPEAEPRREDPGITLMSVGYRQVLPFVERVRRNSPAARAGVQADDLVLSVNGRSISNDEDYEQRLAQLPPTAPLELVLRRGDMILTVRIPATTTTTEETP